MDAVEYGVLFNSKNSKLIVYNTLRQGTSGNSIELRFMNGKILQSNSEKHLGNIIGVGCDQKIIDDFYVRVNMVMSHFSHVASHVRYKLFKTYCMPAIYAQSSNRHLRALAKGAYTRIMRAYDKHASARI